MKNFFKIILLTAFFTPFVALSQSGGETQQIKMLQDQNKTLNENLNNKTKELEALAARVAALEKANIAAVETRLKAVDSRLKAVEEKTKIITIVPNGFYLSKDGTNWLFDVTNDGDLAFERPNKGTVHAMRSRVVAFNVP